MKKIIFASKNPGKVKELNEIFRNSGFVITSLLEMTGIPEIVENGDTFEANAIIKAKTIYELYRIPVISDDSGIAVKQLNWLPGVYSARFAGENAADEENNEKLISSIKLHPEPHIAKYVCCAVYFDGTELFAETGEIYGQIIKVGRGHNGFGYDPYFIPDGYKETMAELNPDEKNRISHRAMAFNKLKLKMMEKNKNE